MMHFDTVVALICSFQHDRECRARDFADNEVLWHTIDDGDCTKGVMSKSRCIDVLRGLQSIDNKVYHLILCRLLSRHLLSPWREWRSGRSYQESMNQAVIAGKCAR